MKRTLLIFSALVLSLSDKAVANETESILQQLPKQLVVQTTVDEQGNENAPRLYVLDAGEKLIQSQQDAEQMVQSLETEQGIVLQTEEISTEIPQIVQQVFQIHLMTGLPQQEIDSEYNALSWSRYYPYRPGIGLYGYGSPGYWGYHSYYHPNRHGHYGVYHSGRVYPYSHLSYFHRSLPHNYYFYYNPYYDWD